MEEQEIQIIKNALLVEDDRIVQRVISTQLAGLGYQVTAVNDVITAIQRIQEYHYDLIVTDLRLPDKSGKEVIKAARQSEVNQGIPVIVSSAQVTNSDFKTYIDLGADAVLVKPYSAAVLKETIQRCHLKPNYQRKFFHQIKACVQSFEESLQQSQTKQEFELWIEHFQTLLTQSLRVLQEYEQWSSFEKLIIPKKKKDT